LASSARPLVSVVIPAYDAARWIRETIASALAQTYRPIEVLVVDDGSTDATVAIAGSFGTAVEVIRQANSGAAAARNAGIARSRGEYVALLDADDVWDARKIEAQVRALDADRSVGALQCGTTYVDEAGRVLEVRRPPGRTTFWDVVRFHGVVALMSTLVIRRSCIDAAGAQETRFEGKDEWEWGMRLARRCGLGGLPEALVTHRVLAASMSRDVASHVRPGLAVLEHVFADPTLPPGLRRRRAAAYAAFYLMLAGGYWQAGDWGAFALWLQRAIAADPVSTASRLASWPARVVARSMSRSGEQGE
jgi:glycosyltransferase involved in cell wall biosynthesis